jgi:HlyD family secretion protein
MDIIKKKKKSFYKNKLFLITTTAVMFLVLVFASTKVELGVFSVESNSIITAKVQRGNLSIKVTAPGVLASRDIRWIASTVEGKVERILAKPGALVEQGQLVVELLNPELTQQTKDLEWELEAMEAETRALKERHKTRLLETKALLLDNQMTYDQEKIRLDAEKELIDKGNSVISLIDFKTRKLLVTKLKKLLTMDKKRMDQLKLTLTAEYEAQTARVNRQSNILKQAKFQLSSLQVRAPVSGVLQLMPLELGQRVLIGDNIAKFAKKGDLMAELNVPEFNASDVRVGQQVIVDTRLNQIMGEVVRVDPSVVQGTIRVDVNLTGDLPDEVRPDLSIDSEIIIAEQLDTLYVRRPTFSQANQTMSVFKLTEGARYAELTKTRFGLSSSINIEVLSGLSESDQIIISEISEFVQHSRIELN